MQMPGILVEYVRFVEVQQRRARMAAELLALRAATPADIVGAAAVDDEPIPVAVSHIDARPTPGNVDVR